MHKQIYSTILGVLILGASCLGQSAQHPVKAPLKNNKPFVSKKQMAEPKSFDDPIWESDFSEDPSLWSIDNDAGNNDDWVIGTEGPSGTFTIGPINSTTADNGFALFDSDLLCSGNQNAWIVNGEPIDISEAEAVSIRFETYFRDFQGSCFLETSLDGEIWDSIEILDLEVNEATDNPITLTYSLPFLNGADEGYVRFRYNGGCDYAWMIDDVVIAATPQLDLRMNDAWYDEFILLEQLDEFETIDYYDNLEFNVYKSGNTRPLTFVAEVENLGTQELTGIILSVELETPESTETFESDPLASLPAFETAVLTIEDVMPEAFMNGGTLGEYTVNFLAAPEEADEDEENNSVPPKTFEVSEQDMANDRGNSYQTTNETSNDCIFANQFTFMEETTINYVSFGLDDEAIYETIGTITTMPGEELWLNIRQGSVLDDEGNGNDVFQLFEEDEVVYTIQEDDISSLGELTWITVMLPEEVDLDPGVIYQSEVQLPPVGEPFALVAITQPQETLAGTLYDFEDPSDGPQGWYTLGQTAPAIRMGYSGPDGVSDTDVLKFSMSQNFPNPVKNGMTQVSWNLFEPAKSVVFTITDVNGKKVYEEDLGARPSGAQENLSVDVSKLPAGVYQYGLLIDRQRLVRKMILTN